MTKQVEYDSLEQKCAEIEQWCAKPAQVLKAKRRVVDYLHRFAKEDQIYEIAKYLNIKTD